MWFQCEDCGDNLKKPKLPGHFRSCSARKVSFFPILITWDSLFGCQENIALNKVLVFNLFSGLLTLLIFFMFQLSCIDCGEMFGQESVQSHTQCITEAVSLLLFSYLII